MKIMHNLITLGVPPTDTTGIQEDILTLSTLPSLVIKLIKNQLQVKKNFL